MTKVLAISEYYNEAENIPGLVQNLAAQSCKPELMIIIDDGSTDNSTEIFENYLKQYKIPYLLYQMPPKAKPNANLKGRAFQNIDILNNEWVESGEYDYLILIAPDTRLPQAYLEFGIKVMNQIPEVGAIGGRIVGESGSDTPMGTGKLVRWKVVKNTSGRYWDLDPDSLWNIIALNMNLRLLIIEDMLMEVTRPTHMYGPGGFYNYGSRMYYVGWSIFHALFYMALLFVRNSHPFQFLRGYMNEYTKGNWFNENREIREFYGFKRMILRMIDAVPMNDRAAIVKLGINLNEELNLDNKIMNQIVAKIKKSMKLR
jgi:glycosyltransferase involved in cell wall biosynthesis